MPTDAWKSQLLSYSKTLVKEEAEEVIEDYVYEGELIQKHAYDEAQKFIKEKFDSTSDSDGFRCFIKKSKRKTKKLKKQEKIEPKRIELIGSSLLLFSV